jgi:cell division protein FtsX
MNFFKQLISTVIICFILQKFFPWWSLAIGAAAIAYWVGNKPFVSFAIGFLAIALLWLGVAYFIDTTTNSILTSKISKLLPLNAFIITAMVGGLVGGLAALTGATFKKSTL